MRDGCLEVATIVSRFPIAFPPPAFASCRPKSPRVGLSSRSAYRARPGASPDLDGLPRSAARAATGVGASIPRGRRSSSRPEDVPDRRLPALPRLVLRPRSSVPSCGALSHEASTRVQALTRYQAPENRMLLLLPRLDGGHSPPEGQFGRSSARIGICRSSGLALRDGV